ncbi:pyridoxamine 5'-phosphate oxidase [Micromonospora jinlongensis]|uniref:Pyridoxine/pyridoxamine 5'-phosphate oxidase n=2 Tax=Micromonospora jinlongensis TaxID=1287877 RepID=A0A7Y9X3K1_9ACTN|nr:pyridoxamine 5'-phosphate oxidase [Micromonospora jinlongensis]
MTGDTPAPAAMRNEYAADLGLTEADLAADWHTQFDSWFADAVAFGLPEPNAMVVGTADPAGRPSGRTVLLKGYDPEGFVFFTNHLSRKGVEASANPYASLVFPWFPMQRQVVVAGRIEPVDRATSEAYFTSRPRGSQLGAWASPQSQVVSGRAELEESYREVTERFADEDVIPTPSHWGGLRVHPESVEFWQGRAGRLHDRLRFRRLDEGGWIVERLAP